MRVVQDRRRPWPQGERRRMRQPPDVERRSVERRLSRFRCEGTLIDAAP